MSIHAPGVSMLPRGASNSASQSTGDMSQLQQQCQGPDRSPTYSSNGNKDTPSSIPTKRLSTSSPGSDQRLAKCPLPFTSLSPKLNDHAAKATCHKDFFHCLTERQSDDTPARFDCEIAFGGACDDLSDWLCKHADLVPALEKEVLSCLTLVTKNVKYAPWSCLELCKKLMASYPSLTSSGQGSLLKLHNEIRQSQNLLPVKPPTLVSLMSAPPHTNPSPTPLTNSNQVPLDKTSDLPPVITSTPTSSVSSVGTHVGTTIPADLPAYARLQLPQMHWRVDPKAPAGIPTSQQRSTASVVPTTAPLLPPLPPAVAVSASLGQPLNSQTVIQSQSQQAQPQQPASQQLHRLQHQIHQQMVVEQQNFRQQYEQYQQSQSMLQTRYALLQQQQQRALQRQQLQYHRQPPQGIKSGQPVAYSSAMIMPGHVSDSAGPYVQTQARYRQIATQQPQPAPSKVQPFHQQRPLYPQPPSPQSPQSPRQVASPGRLQSTDQLRSGPPGSAQTQISSPRPSSSSMLTAQPASQSTQQQSQGPFRLAPSTVPAHLPSLPQVQAQSAQPSPPAQQLQHSSLLQTQPSPSPSSSDTQRPVAQAIQPVQQPRPSNQVLAQLVASHLAKQGQTRITEPQSLPLYMYESSFILRPCTIRQNASDSKFDFFIGDNYIKNIYLSKDRPVQAYNNINSIPQTAPMEAYLFGSKVSWPKRASAVACEWPTCCSIEVNGRPVKPEQRQRVLSGGNYINIGTDRPFNLKSHIQPGRNKLRVIHRKDGCGCRSEFAILLYQCVSHDIIYRFVEAKVLPRSKGESLVNGLLGSGANEADDEVQVTQPFVRLPLTCPISFKRMQLPVKGLACKHIECFDLRCFLEMNKGLASWKCPHCRTHTPPLRLVVDEYLGYLLQAVPKDAKTIELRGNSQTWVVTDRDDSDDDEGDDDSVGERIKGEPADAMASNQPPPPVSAARQPAPVVISLLSDDDDDDDNDHTQRPSAAPVSPQSLETTAPVAAIVNVPNTNLALALPRRPTSSFSLPCPASLPSSVPLSTPTTVNLSLPMPAPVPIATSTMLTNTAQSTLLAPSMPSPVSLPTNEPAEFTLPGSTPKSHPDVSGAHVTSLPRLPMIPESHPQAPGTDLSSSTIRPPQAFSSPTAASPPSVVPEKKVNDAASISSNAHSSFGLVTAGERDTSTSSEWTSVFDVLFQSN
ncbi:hypothetical protein DM01DRAFT_1383877 [Hesseltinella vesiculosa]|uniref:SP-RING-type domain-containing protein n=1 Tax=Hesseltinella vesiculosa TaxID=101127 RepID=A0A1X2GFK8_9FUNG|nr:hypothetical protein DM01DRAFT_1383877 [Hesseltinella vesiculosa]